MNTRTAFSISAQNTVWILDTRKTVLDFFKDIHDIRHSFRLFAENTAPDGVIVLNGAIEQHEAITEGLSAKII